jgi:hypothetical protein
MVDGRAVAGQAVLTGGRRRTGTRIASRELRTNADGIAAVPLTARGRWYVKFIRMTPTKGNHGNYESKWATLTFELK